MSKANNIRGNNTKNQERDLYPVLHKLLRITVHTATYANLPANIKMLGKLILHLKGPTQYLWGSDKFWNNIAKTATKEISK